MGHCGPVGKDRLKAEKEDLTKKGYSCSELAAGQMSYGCSKKGHILPWKVESDLRVKQCVQINGHTKVMIKIIDYVIASKTYIDKVIDNELSQVRNLPPHPNLVLLYDIFRSADSYRAYLIHEDPEGSDVIEYMTQQKFSEKRARDVIVQIVSALRHCHKHNHLHRDLHSNSIRVDKAGNVKVLDFGLSPKLSVRDSKYLHTYNKYAFKAPETLFTQKDPTPAADMFSLGVVMYEMLHGSLPYTGTQEQLERRMKMQDLTFGAHISKEAKMLMRKLLAPDPWKRPTAAAVLEHPWTCGLSVDTCLNKAKVKEEVPTSLPNVAYNGGLDNVRKHGSIKFGKETVVLKSLLPDKQRAYAMGMPYPEMCKSVPTKKQKKDTGGPVSAQPVPRQATRRVRPGKPRPQPQSKDDLIKNSLHVMALKRPAQLSTPDLMSDVGMGDDPFGSEPARTESVMSIIGFGGSDSVTSISDSEKIAGSAKSESSEGDRTLMYLSDDDDDEAADNKGMPQLPLLEQVGQACLAQRRKVPSPVTPDYDPVMETDFSYKSDRGSPIPSDLASAEVDLDFGAPRTPIWARRRRVRVKPISPNPLTELKCKLDQQGNWDGDRIYGYLSDVWSGVPTNDPVREVGPPPPPQPDLPKMVHVPHPPETKRPTNLRERKCHRKVTAAPPSRPKKELAPIRGLAGSAIPLLCPSKPIKPTPAPVKTTKAASVLQNLPAKPVGRRINVTPEKLVPVTLNHASPHDFPRVSTNNLNLNVEKNPLTVSSDTRPAGPNWTEGRATFLPHQRWVKPRTKAISQRDLTYTDVSALRSDPHIKAASQRDFVEQSFRTLPYCPQPPATRRDSKLAARTGLSQNALNTKGTAQANAFPTPGAASLEKLKPCPVIKKSLIGEKSLLRSFCRTGSLNASSRQVRARIEPFNPLSMNTLRLVKDCDAAVINTGVAIRKLSCN